MNGGLHVSPSALHDTKHGFKMIFLCFTGFIFVHGLTLFLCYPRFGEFNVHIKNSLGEKKITLVFKWFVVDGLSLVFCFYQTFLLLPCLT